MKKCIEDLLTTKNIGWTGVLPAFRLRAGVTTCSALSLVGVCLVLTACAGPELEPSVPVSPPVQASVQSPPESPLIMPGALPHRQAPNGSLWAAGSGSLYQDIKAHDVGDILTITVSEESSASKSAKTQASRDRGYSGTLAFDGLTAGGKTVLSPLEFGPYEGKFGSTFNGQGSTSKSDSMTTYMTATVVEVLPNGNLFIRGSRWTKVNNEMQQIILEGVVRPIDITRKNTVLSQNIADAKIFFEGKGPLSQQQKPGWLLQLMDMVSPF